MDWDEKRKKIDGKSKIKGRKNRVWGMERTKDRNKRNGKRRWRMDGRKYSAWGYGLLTKGFNSIPTLFVA
jgi:hypothetical protein